MAGAVRRRKTRWTVHAVERISAAVITLGGIGTIVAVSLVGAFLVYVAVPLFQPASIRKTGSSQPALAGRGGPAPVGFGVDEERLLSWRLFAEGSLQVARLDTGKVIRNEELFPGASSLSASVAGDRAVFGFEDGSIRMLELKFRPTFLEPEALSEEAAAGLERGTPVELEGGLGVSTPTGQIRLTRLELDIGAPIQAAEGVGVVLVDMSQTPTGPVVATLDDSGTLRVQALRERRNMLTGQVTIRAETAVLPFDIAARGRPAFLRLAGNGDQVYLGWRDGWCMRFRVFDFDRPFLAEERNLLGGVDEEVTCFDFLLGKATLLAGDSRGRISAWFPAPREEPGEGDGFALVAAHVLQGPAAPVSALAASGRTRMVAVGFGDGSLQVFHVTSRKLLAAVKIPGGKPVLSTAFSPKDDGLFGDTGGATYAWSMDPGHPEASLAALFLPVWYEGYPDARHVWQSTSATDETEPKLGLVPCIVGTLKATLYSLLFGVPLALLAALYTSEFLHPRAKARIKPTIELMASLPSVVLGFLAALVFAPVVERFLPAVLAAFFVLPTTLLLGAHLWQLLPRHKALGWHRWRALFIFLALPVGLGASLAIGPLLESALFAGDIKAWLDGRVGSGLGGWFLIFIPFAAFLSALAVGRLAGPRIDRAAAGGGGRLPTLLAGKLAAGIVLTLALSLGLALAFSLAGWDPRGSFLGTYVQRNALVVGFVMGFAIIPIIYTIAEDALSSVPAHLRSASLASGATPWQTAVRVIIPTAMSGLFSSVMIGLGRAVGETMIVLMAAGNTPILDMNIFNGFRTLSANIAVELPEAVQGSTHYRILFLSALVLFGMTFVVNTLAELVRLRFRRKVVEL